MAEPPEPPKLFVSYSWSGPDHEAWVIRLAEDLVDSGVHVILDKWDLREGHDAIIFMERLVNDPDIRKVILVCDRQYQEKADRRSGGAGTEAQIITPELYGNVENNKFCAVIAERDDHGKPYLPAYYRSRIYIDLSDESERVSNFEKLIRWVFDKPMYTRPALGTPPSYVTEENATIQLHTSTHARRAIDALRNVKPFWKPALDEYLDALTAGLDLLRYPVDPDYPIVVLQCIDKFRPHRDEFIGVIAVASRYVVTLEISDSLRRFFEKSACYLYRQQGRMQWNENEFDGFRFILYELFIYCVALFIAAEKFDILELLLQREYYISSRSADGLDPLTPFTFFQQSVPAFELINQQSNPRLYFPRARRLLDRVPGSGLEPNALMEADFVCALASQARTGAHWWYPDTLIYDGRSNPHPAFARSKSTSYYKKVRQAIGLPSDELKALASRVDNHGELFQHVAYYRFCMARLIGSDNLATTP